jgi:predicted  nucleic acid-binding Zn-ribbon protein
MYMLAVCTLDRPPAQPLPGSAYLDVSDKLLSDWTRRLDDALREIEKLNREVRELGLWGRSLDQEIRDRDQAIRDLQGTMASEVAQRDQTILSLQKEFEERGRWALALQDELQRTNTELERVNGELGRVAGHLARIRHALLYRALCRLGLLPK